MAHLFFFNSPHTLDSLLGNTTALVDVVAEGIGYQTDEEYLAVTGIVIQILEGRLNDTNWDVRSLGSLGLFAERHEDGTPYTYVEAGLSTSVVSSLPPAMLARFDQEFAETMDNL